MDTLRPNGRSQRRALVVNAEATTSQLYRDVLERGGFTVDVVDSGIAAVVTARRVLPDLILVDEQLRDVPGREAVLWLRSNPELRATPIVVLTMGAGDAVDINIATPGALLQKPASIGSIRQIIHEIFS
jgi:two-component system cell cycle response regulator DivK